MPQTPPVTLADLRREIDRIDAGMHALLMERGEIIDQLIAIKRSQATASAFRPGREASMMREIVGRHRGILPVDIVESIWRVIIATFTHVQSPYTVHGDISLGGAAMRDVARFHFGFVVPYQTHDDAGDVIHALSASRGDLGLVPVDDRVRTIADGVSPAEYGRREAYTVHQALKEKGPVTVPREFVFMDRAAIGLGGVFLHLRAELNFHRLFEEAIEDFSTQTVAARQQEALAAVGLG